MRPYIVTAGTPRELASAEELVSTLNKRTSPVGVRTLVFDELWNRADNGVHRAFAGWMRSLPQCRLALTVEYPNCCDRGARVTVDGAQQFGAALLDSLVEVGLS